MRTLPKPAPKPSTTASVGTLIAALFLIPINAIVGGLVVRYLYHRLMAPTFHSLPQHIGIAAAIGLSLFVGYFTVDEPSALTDHRPLLEKQFSWLAYRGLVVLFALVLGWFM